jgi:hypothetical protein
MIEQLLVMMSIALFSIPTNYKLPSNKQTTILSDVGPTSLNIQPAQQTSKIVQKHPTSKETIKE